MSATTRAPRPGEADGRDYEFLSRSEFERRREAGDFLEWFEVYGDLKGTPRSPVEQRLAAGRDVLVEVDVQGARAVRASFPDALVVFLRAPSPAEQRERLERRGADDAASIERRLAAAAREEAAAAAFDAVVVNDDVDRAVREIAGILERRRAEHSDPPPARSSEPRPGDEGSR